jgi:hypothetical protein
MALKNYFFDVLPFDLQEHILNINKKETLQTCFNALYNNRWDNKNKDYKKRKFWSLDLTTIKIITIEKMTRFKKFKEGLNLIREETKEKIKKILERKKFLIEYFKKPPPNIDDFQEVKEIDGYLMIEFKNDEEQSLYYRLSRVWEDRAHELENISYKIGLVKRNRDYEINGLKDDYIKNYYLKFDYDDEIYNRDFKNEMVKKYRY